MVDLAKYQKAVTKTTGTKPVHYIRFASTGTKNKEPEPWEIRAYNIVHELMKKEGMTSDQIKYMIYEELLSPVGDEMGIK